MRHGETFSPLLGRELPASLPAALAIGRTHRHSAIVERRGAADLSDARLD